MRLSLSAGKDPPTPSSVVGCCPTGREPPWSVSGSRWPVELEGVGSILHRLWAQSVRSTETVARGIEVEPVGSWVWVMELSLWCRAVSNCLDAQGCGRWGMVPKRLPGHGMLQTDELGASAGTTAVINSHHQSHQLAAGYAWWVHRGWEPTMHPI